MKNDCYLTVNMYNNMKLESYNKKRNFDKTSEPEGVVTKDAGRLIFVVQWHKASHLHFDFRLEWDGVLKSWAVPKGPSMNPAEKRLAVMVEDHPLEYAKFEGGIPEGEYGAGEVRIWDNGTWSPFEEFEDVDKALKNGLLEFELKGKNLKGGFALVEMKKSTTPNSWLLIKKDDKYAVREDYNAYDIPAVHR